MANMMTAPSTLSAPPPARRNHHPHRARRWLPYLGLTALAVLITAGLWPQPVPVEIARVSVGPLRATINEEGKTRIKQRYVVAAPLTGQLRRIPYKSGAEVEAGMTVLAVIDPLTPALLDPRGRAVAEARRDTANANLEKARATHQFAASELRRLEKLFAEKTASFQELEAAQWRETAAAKDLAAATSTLRQAEAELAEFAPPVNPQGPPHPTELKAPISGRVLRVFEESVRVVAAGTPLLELGDPADLEAVIEVLSRDGAALRPGTPVELEQWGGSQPLAARVRLVEPAAFTKVSALGVEEQRVNVVLDLLAPPAARGGLGDNYRVEARIVIWEDPQALKVPSGALFRRGGRWAALVVAGGRAWLRPVQVGRSSGPETQVVAGLEAGTAVILYPGDRIREGQRVRPIQL